MSFRTAQFIVISAGIIFIALLFSIYPNLKFNNDYWLPKNNQYQQVLDYLEDEFQPGFGSIIVLEFKDPYFSKKNIDFFKSFKKSVENLPYVFKVNSPLDATVIINNEDLLTIQTYEEAIDDGHIKDINHYKSIFMKSPYYGKLLSKNHRFVGLSVSIDKKNDGNDLERRVSSIQQIQKLINNLPPHIKGFVSGDAAIYYEMDGATQKNLIRLLPIAFILLLFVSWLFLKQWRSVSIIIIPTLVNLGLVPIILVLFNHYITIINITLFILVLVISVADAIHMLNYWERFKVNQSPHPIADTIRSTWLPCFITSISTAVGFGSFITSSIIPLRQYGLQAFIVMLFAYIIVMTVVPILLKAIPPKIKQKSDIELFPTFVKKMTIFIINHAKKITICFFLFAILIAQGLWLSTTETSFISVFFKKNHSVQTNVHKVDDQLLGSGRIDIILQANTPEKFKQINVFNTMKDNISTSLQHPLLNGVHDLALPISMIHKAFKTSNSTFPQTDAELEQELLFLEFSRGENKTDVLSSVVDFNYKNARIEFITNQLPSSKIKNIIKELNRSFSNWEFGNVIITGSQFLSYVLGQYILESQLITICITLLFVWLLFTVLFGFKLGSIGMLPNIIPMIITLSLIPLSGNSFDFATVLISSITLGLCVDDTIHWLHYFKLSKEKNIKAPAINTSITMFKPLLLTSIILGIGFGVLGFADLVILQKFGIFTTIAIFLAFFSDIVILPALLRCFKMSK